MKKKLIIITALILILVGLGFHLYKRSHKTESLPTVTAEKGSITEQAEAIGYIRPRHSITVKSQIDGTVAELYHNEGDYVKQGDPLMKISPNPSPYEYVSTYQTLKSAEAVEKTTAQDLKRYQDALKAGIITNNFSEYVAAQKSYATAKIDHRLAAQKLALLEKGGVKIGTKNIENMVVSPINGYIINRIVDIGEPVISLSSNQASTALFSMADMNDLMFEGTVDEMDASKIKLDMPTIVTIGSLPDTKIQGTLSKIALQSDKENNAKATPTDTSASPFNVGFKIQVINLALPPKTTIRSGYSATAKIKIRTVSDVIVLPARVIQYKDEKPYVLLPPADNKAKPKEQPVTIGLSDGMNVEIKSGLKLGDKILDKQVTKPTENND